MIIPAIVAVLIIVLVVTIVSITRVNSYETLIVTNSGDIDKTLESGFSLVNPLSETHRIDERKRRVNIPELGTIGSDDDSLLMDGFYAIISVSDAEKVFDMESTIESRVSYEVQNLLKQVAKNSSVEGIDGKEIASLVEDKLRKKEDEFGIEVNSVEPGEVRRE